MKYVKTFEGFVSPSDKNIEGDYYEIASIIAEGLITLGFNEKFKEKVYYDEKTDLIMDLIFNCQKKKEEMNSILRRAKISMTAFGYNDMYKCELIVNDGSFILRIQCK